MQWRLERAMRWMRLGAWAGLLCAPFLVWGQDYTPVEEELAAGERDADARTAALSGATVARSRGLDAVLTNPAGLAALTYSEASGSLTYRRIGLETQLGSNAPFSQSGSGVQFGHLGVAHRFEAHPWLGLGASYQLSRDLDRVSLVEGIETLGPSAGEYIREAAETDGHVRTLSLAMGVEAARGVRLGIGLQQWDGDSRRELEYEAGGVVYQDETHRHFTATRLKLSTEVGLTPFLSLGALAHLPCDVDIQEDWSQLDLVRSRTGASSSASGATTYGFHMPLELEAGAAVTLYRWRLFAALRHADWRNASYRGGPAADIDTDQFAYLYEGETELKIGAEHWFENEIALRGGFRFRSARLSSDWKESEGVPFGVSLGAGLPMGEAAFVDLAYEAELWERFGDDLAEDASSHRLLIGARWLF